MKKNICLVMCLLCVTTIFSQPQRGRGYPEKNPSNLHGSFMTPPKGFGNVPFYWWQGDSLSIDRLKEQLEILSKSATDGFAVSYAHTDPRIDKEKAIHGYGFAGNTEPGAPEIFSKEWWNVWKKYAEECAKYGIGVGLDDYTFGWPNNGYFPDEIKAMPGFSDYPGYLDVESIVIAGGETFERKKPDHFVIAVAWPGKHTIANTESGVIKWTAPQGKEKEYKVYVITTKNGFTIHPEHGKMLVELYFGQFEKNLTEKQLQSMNYFFQDELTYPINMVTWSRDFGAEFLKRKGYDILPYLPALVTDIGTETPKIRLDYCDVLLDLAEERYFKPIYDWHANKGLIYGSDNHGRGKDPLAYIDYFRANSWYTAPGNDAPSRGSSFIETKVSSSISHIYKRPRTWLEAFHSMGWGSTGAWLTEQIDHHFIAGGNLVCMHGLYYSTHGGWWEWAPPCFHFRMPYWPHMIKWLEYTERMSYVLSQGTHACDIALMYPTESMQAYPEATPDLAFNLAKNLSEHGLDYDFMHYKPLSEAIISDGNLTVSDESYKILILADLWACHESTLQKALEHYRKGGIVIATGRLPQATTSEGEHSAKTNAILTELFGATTLQTKPSFACENAAGGRSMYLQPEEIVGKIRELIVPDFLPSTGKGRVLHRKIGDKELYMVTNIEKGDVCFFRSHGKVELWDASNGEKQIYPVVKVDKHGTHLKLEKESNQSYLILFTPGDPELLKHEEKNTLIQTIPLTGEWGIEFLPTMNNKWGDYRLPASNEMIGPEAPVFRYRKSISEKESWVANSYQDTDWRQSIYGYGIQAETVEIDTTVLFSEAVSRVRTDQKLAWVPYEFSWLHGVWDNPGSQGFHGLKSRVSDGFFILNKGSHQFFKTYVWIPVTGSYKVVIEDYHPDLLLLKDTPTEAGVAVKMNKGWHELLIGYMNTPKMSYEKSPFDFDPRRRSMVAVIPENAKMIKKTGMYDHVISSTWGRSDHMLYSPYPDKRNNWQFRVKTVPGLKGLSLAVYGKVKALWLAEHKVMQKHITLQKQENNINYYYINLPEVHRTIETLAFEIEAFTGYQGAAIHNQPIKFHCEKGMMEAGNWADLGALRYYSGGIYYRKTFNSNLQAGQKLELSLGDIIATCEVKINGQSAGILMSPPYKTDISSYIVHGENEIEVLVYNTLSNHYQTTPSFYRGEPNAGLIGPVELKIYDTNRMEIEDAI